MNHSISIPCTCAVLGAILLGPSSAFAGDAKAALRDSIDKLREAQAFSMEVKRKIDPKLVDSRALPVDARVKLLVKRPNMLRAEITGENVDRTLYFDGKKVTIADNKALRYAQREVVGNLDDLVEAIEEKLGFSPPLADFIVSDPWPRFVTGETVLEDKGEADVDGVKCNLLKGVEEDVMGWSLWLDAGTSLPRKLVVTATALEGNPELIVEFVKVDLAAKPSDADFTYTPPEGAKEAKILQGEAEAEGKKE